MNKDGTIRKGRWDLPLDEEAKMYAALDACASLAVYLDLTGIVEASDVVIVTRTWTLREYQKRRSASVPSTSEVSSSNSSSSSSISPASSSPTTSNTTSSGRSMSSSSNSTTSSPAQREFQIDAVPDWLNPRTPKKLNSERKPYEHKVLSRDYPEVLLATSMTVSTRLLALKY